MQTPGGVGRRKTMPSDDRHFAWRTKRKFFSVKDLLGMDNDGSADTSLSQGTPTMEAATTIEVASVPMTTADEVQHVFPIPWDLDRDQTMRVRVFFQHASTDADTPQFKFGYKFFGRQDALVEIKGGVDKDVTLTAHTCSTTNNSLEVTNWNDLDTESYIASDDILMGVCLELDALGSAGADECKVFGFELEWTIDAFDSYRHETKDDPKDSV
jgi:hypothetical protein